MFSVTYKRRYSSAFFFWRMVGQWDDICIVAEEPTPPPRRKRKREGAHGRRRPKHGPHTPSAPTRQRRNEPPHGAPEPPPSARRGRDVTAGFRLDAPPGRDATTRSVATAPAWQDHLARRAHAATGRHAMHGRLRGSNRGTDHAAGRRPASRCSIAPRHRLNPDVSPAAPLNPRRPRGHRPRPTANTPPSPDAPGIVSDGPAHSAASTRQMEWMP